MLYGSLVGTSDSLRSCSHHAWPSLLLLGSDYLNDLAVVTPVLTG